jgi:hypothetical protein
MEKIGEGLQYIVYSEGDRVRKEPKQRKEMIEMASNWYDSKSKAVENVEMALKRRKNTVKEIRSRDIPGDLFGNLVFKENGVVLQDVLAPVDQRLRSVESLEKKEQVVDDYVDLLHTLWSYGIGDTIYNFTINNGYNQKDRMVQMDFGELVFTKEKIEEKVRENAWLEMRSYEHDISKELKPYYRKKMQKELTVEKLEDVWREKI